jgi:putative PIN family toxin of toxin-antitoxin system
MRVILDTNVIIAAFATRGLCSALFELCLDRFDLVLSQAILQETDAHLQSKIKLPPAQCKAILSFLRDQAVIAEIDVIPPSACQDPKDLHLLGLAQRTAADDLVTGDRDLLTLGRYGTTVIVTPRSFWDAAKA